ncbi:hypothetical protein [Algibacter lectus]|uniref:hypothetical protein n=1 Tax=Algibacter lectus TaxID=221126 RepID=UPI0026ED3D15|nr:hypothetical protein [Algibacter lectus]MDO7135921.1 hypothetical protein [Algibacter lectus]
MKELIEIYKKIELDHRLLQIYNKEIVPPNFFDTWKPVEDFFYPFPPFFIPLFVDQGDPSYIGVIHHFFTNRTPVFVQYDLSAGYMWEIARNSDQLLQDILIQSIEANDDIIDSSIESFAQEINMNIDKAFLNTYNNEYDGDAFDTYKLFDLFSNETPSAYVDSLSDYDGDFPSVKDEMNPKTIQKLSSFEIDEEIDVSEIDNLPIWIHEDIDKNKMFEEFMSNLDFEKAWFTLNSKNWKYSDVKEKLTNLRQQTTVDPIFKLISKTWINQWSKSNFAEKQDFIY